LVQLRIAPQNPKTPNNFRFNLLKIIIVKCINKFRKRIN